MPLSERILLLSAGLCGALGVIFEAMAAHGDYAAWLKTGADFLLFHAGALLALVAMIRTQHAPRHALSAGGFLILLGLLLFSGDLIWRTFTGAAHLFTNAAPIGGSAMIGGWFLVAIAAFAPPRSG
ncbi:MAG: DUF423 domain-containing protein [Burkholderiales bacterium]|nr:DUF423 domain-containing protein [Burkholderiales bacterium]